ncbi:hypothetical protein F6P84_04590 [Streptococcus suis]|nr:hypothetical protein [Streptococcus suis]MBS8075114.1 hypothetical protein [Streptococcus suis]MBS8096429.1 hypothetical protein [Streptococcus suis]MBS8105241.1 hypothetical protein [Streptococcus suis]
MSWTHVTNVILYSTKIKSSLGNEVKDRSGVHQGKLTTDNFDIRRVLNNAAKKESFWTLHLFTT